MTKPQEFTVCVSTASPYKFPKTIAKALGLDSSKDEIALIEEIKNKTGVMPDERILALKDIKLNPFVCEKDKIKENVVKKVKEYAKN